MENGAKWTFMVYMAGNNNLSPAGEIDLGEMAQVGSSEDVNILVEFDRADHSKNTKRYLVEKGHVVLPRSGD